MHARGCAPATIEAYTAGIRKFTPRELRKATGDELLARLSILSLSPATRALYLGAVRAFRRFAGGADIRAARILQRSPRPRPLAPDQERALQAAALRPSGDRYANRIALFYSLCRDLGLRPSEALALQWSAVQLEPGREEITIRDAKGRWTATIPIDPHGPCGLARRLRRELAVFIVPDRKRYVIPGRRSVCEPWSYRAALDAWGKVCKRAGVEATPHQLRHTAGTAWLRSGLSPEHVRRLLRHRTTAMLGVYAEITPVDLRQVLDPDSPAVRR